MPLLILKSQTALLGLQLVSLCCIYYNQTSYIKGPSNPKVSFPGAIFLAAVSLHVRYI